MRRYYNSVSSPLGAPVYKAQVRILKADTTPAQLYSDNGITTLTQPVLTDGLGEFSFFVADGTYTMTVADPDGSNVRSFANVEIYEDARNVSVPPGEAGITLPSAAGRAGKILAFDGTGQPVASVYDPGVAAAAAAASAAAAAISATAAATSAATATTGASSAGASSTTAAAARDAAIIAAATSGVYPNSAASNVPRGLTQASVGTITAGTGGTNGTFALGWTGGNFDINPTGTFTVAGGVLTAVSITGPGLRIGATATVPTPSFSASAGLTGAAVALTAQFLVTNGSGYWVQSADNSEIDRYANISGVATAVTGVGPIPITGLTTPVAELQNAGGNKNIFPDPFFTSTSLTLGFAPAQSDPPYVLSGAWDPMTNASTGSPYPAGRLLNRPAGNVSVPQIFIYLDNMGLTAGDVIQIVQEMFLAAGATPASSGDFCTAQWYTREPVVVGSSFSILTPTSGNPLDTTCKSWNSGSLTIPTGAAVLRLQYPQVVAFARSIASFQIVKIVNGNTAPSKPVQRPPVADAANRLAVLEAQAPGSIRNGVLMRRSTYASASTAYPVGTMGAALNTFNNNSGYGQSYLAAACPTLGFNMISTPLNWTPNAATGPARIEVVVRTCATGSNPLTVGKTIAWGYIDVDPSAGTASGESIQLFDPLTGAAKTVMPADLLDLMGIGIVSVNSQGNTNGANTQLYVTYATHSNADPALIGYQASGAPSGVASSWQSIGGSNSWVPQLTLAVSPMTANKTPSATFASAVGALVDEPPVIIALPKTVYAVVGREASIYYDAVQQRDAKRTNFTASWTGAVPSASGAQEERIKYVPTAATTNTLTLSAYRGDLFSSSATCAITSVAASAASGTKVIHCLGDSLIENAGMLTALRAISVEAGSVTSLTFIGSKGSAPLLNDGYSGMPLGAFRGAVLGGGANPFYNGSDFNYAYWKSHAGAAFAAADFVFIEAGGVDVGAVTSDADAQAAATTWAAHAEFIAASIRSANPSTKIVFYTKEAGPIPGQMPSPDPVSSYGMLWRIRRNWRILAAKSISQFGNRASDGIYVTPTAAAIDPENGWGRTFTPRSASVTRDMVTYTTYALMQADLAKAAGIVAYATDTASYHIKMGGSGVGFWRSARIEDGFIMRHTDTVHYALGSLQVAEANWAVIKALG